MCMRQLASTAVSASAPVASTLRSFSRRMAVEMSANLTANVPPKPQHAVESFISASSSPSTDESSLRGCSATPRSRSAWQQSW